MTFSVRLQDIQRAYSWVAVRQLVKWGLHKTSQQAYERRYQQTQQIKKIPGQEIPKGARSGTQARTRSVSRAYFR